MAFAATSSSASSEINVTPLIDVLLVLLIIFMVIIPAAPRGLDSSVPQGKPREETARPPVVVRLRTASVGERTSYWIGERELAYSDLRPAMQAMFAVRQDRTLFVQADRGLRFQQVAEVVGEGRMAGAGAVVLDKIPQP